MSNSHELISIQAFPTYQQFRGIDIPYNTTIFEEGGVCVYPSAVKEQYRDLGVIVARSIFTPGQEFEYDPDEIAFKKAFVAGAMFGLIEKKCGPDQETIMRIRGVSTSNPWFVCFKQPKDITNPYKPYFPLQFDAISHTMTSLRMSPEQKIALRADLRNITKG